MRRYQYGIIVGLCLILAACGGQTVTSTAIPATSTIAATPTAPTLATATRAASATPGQIPGQRVTPSPSAFSLRLDAGTCGIGTLDTAAGTFTRKIESSQPAQAVTLTLSGQDLAAIRQKIVEIGFFDYPENFVASPASGATGARITPSITYTIEVQLDGQRKRVVWNDDLSGAVNPEAENLRALIRTIEAAIQSTPEYRGLPQRNFGCL